MHAPPCFGKFPCSVGKFSKATLVLESYACTSCFEKFPCSVGKFSKATLVLESCYVVFWKVFKSSIAACLNIGFIFFLEDGRCIPPI
jgi:hypothetical protein